MNKLSRVMLRRRIHTVELELGWFGIIGVGVTVMCLAFYVSALIPAKLKLDDLRDNISRLKINGEDRVGNANATLTQAEQLAVFYGSFPKMNSVPASLEKIYATAAEEQLSLDRADYKASSDSGERMARYQVTLPIRGQYSKIQGFLVKVLKRIPNASLEYVSFQRSRIGDSTVEATVILVLNLVID
jgi:hypothetical protein